MALKLFKNMKKKSVSILLMGLTGAVERPAAWFRYYAGKAPFYRVNVFTHGMTRGPLAFRRVVSFFFGFMAIIQADIIIVLPMTQTKPFFVFMLRLARWLNKVIILDFYISVYEAELQRGRITKTDPATVKMLKHERSAVLGSDLVIFLSRVERKHYLGLLGVNEDSVHSEILPLITQERTKALLPYTNTSSKREPLIIWWARLGNPIHGFEVIVEAIKLLIDSGFKARFGLYGAGEDEYEDAKTRYPFLVDHESIEFRSDVSFGNGKLGEILEFQADLALGAFGNSTKAKTVVLNKIIESAAYGVPVLTIKSSGLSEVFEDGKSIYYCDPTPPTLAKAIITVFKNRSSNKVVGDNARNVYRKHFSPNAFNERLRVIMKTILDD